MFSTAEAKAHLRVSHTYEDTQIDAWVAAATGIYDGRDGILWRSLMQQTWVWKLAGFPPSRELYIPLPPLVSVTSIKYQDADDAEQTLSADNYYTYAQAPVGYVKLKPGASWPSVYERDDAVSVTFVAGYANAAAVPAPIKQAILMRLAYLYSARGDADKSQDPLDRVISETERRLVAPYKVQQFGFPHVEYWREARNDCR